MRENQTPPGGFREGSEGEIDQLVYRYNAGESIPPPPAEVSQHAEMARSRMRTESGSWNLDAALGGMRNHYERALEKAVYEIKVAHEREKAEALTKQLEEVKSARAATAEWWRDLAKHTLAPVLAIGIVITIGTIVAAAVYFKIHASAP